MSIILALAPHPDDLEIGCGGTLAQHAKRGDEVHIFVATSGEVGGDAEIRKAEQIASAKILGVQAVHWGNFVDTTLPKFAPDLMASVEALVQSLKPDTVYVNFHQDTHQDHRELAQAVRSATRYVANVLAYETPSTIGFEPSAFMDISDTLPLKIEALQAHASQVDRTHVHLNILEIAMATSHFRGVQGKLSCAESFVPVRMRL